ncbi:choice-of-anchor A family protein [Sphingomonas desiccabilis]|uniref:Choice-of-anchor A family protein n=1 Tax=Sphingomonas desiccabilis TaxID=429134 RepID=A0A4V1QP72_9SPHN|nr:choice-of-anchor A family protein [Sphingomonas desiccabilis]MBB3911028.1 choice-of-anchor A domain-containing protein [Sphingomonas desiccabilis]RXZ32154.1 choice-of-anchor A family protein [Sphingomonas desiccabilis]
MKTRLLIAALSATALALPAAASPVVGVDALKEWNLIVLGDLTSSSEVEGRTFVGGNLDGNSSNYQIKTPPPSSYDTPGLIVVGDVTGGAKNLNNGSGAVVGGNVNSGFNLNGAPQTVQVGGSIANTNVNQNTVNSGLASNAGFLEGLQQQKSLLTSGMTDLSQGMTKLEANSTVTFANNRATFNAKPDAKGVAVFNLTADDLNRIGEIQFNLNGADTAIVNVSGANIMLNDNFLGGTQGLGEHVIWNFADAKNLSLTTAWGGSVLAPGAAANTGNYIQGSAVFGSLVQNGEFHLGTYTGGYTPTTPTDPGGPKPVPEPGTWALMLAGLGLVALLLRRRRGVAA